MELNTGVAWAILLIRTVHSQMASDLYMQRILATPHNPEWTDHCPVHYQCCKVIQILDSFDVERRLATVQYILRAYSDMFSHIDGILRA